MTLIIIIDTSSNKVLEILANMYVYLKLPRILRTAFIIVYVNNKALVNSSGINTWITADHERENCIEQHSKQDLLNSNILFTIA